MVGVIRDGTVEVVAATKDGDYLIFDGGTYGEIVLMKNSPSWIIFVGIGAAVVAAVFVVMKKCGIKRRTQRRK